MVSSLKLTTFVSTNEKVREIAGYPTCADVPEDDEGKPPASFIGEGIPPAPRSDTLRASGSVAAVEPVVPKGELSCTRASWTCRQCGLDAVDLVQCI